MKYLRRIRRQLESKQNQIAMHLETVRALILEAQDLNDKESELILKDMESKMSDLNEFISVAVNNLGIGNYKIDC